MANRNIMTEEENGKMKILQDEINRLQDIYNIKCDEYRELILINGRLRRKLDDNNIENED